MFGFSDNIHDNIFDTHKFYTSVEYHLIFQYIDTLCNVQIRINIPPVSYAYHFFVMKKTQSFIEF